MPERGPELVPVEKKEDIKYFMRTAEAVEKYRKEKPEVIHSTRKIDLAGNQIALKKIFEEQGVKVKTRDQKVSGIRIGENERIDVYNPSNEFELNGETYVAARAEPRTSKFDPRVIFFKKVGEQWEPQSASIFELEDPSIAKIGDELVLCGVEIEIVAQSRFQQLFNRAKDNKKAKDNKRVTSWKTVFYKGKSLDDLTRFAEGPGDMKDVRLVELPDGRIGVYTRPQKEKVKPGQINIRLVQFPNREMGYQILHNKEIDIPGQIGFTIIDKLSDLNAKVIKDAPLLSIRFPKGEWGGVNEATLLPDGRVFVLGHRAIFDSKKVRHYYPWAFIHDPKTGAIEDLGILAERSEFPEGPAKRKDLVDVLFSSGMKLLKSGRMLLRVGMSDAETGEKECEMPPALKRALGLT